MMDLSEEGSRSDDTKKRCTDCQTSKTPLWRGGPDGPKSLCNACGIRYRKKRRNLLGLNKGGTEEKKKKKKKKGTKNKKLEGVSLKLRLLSLGGKVVLQRSSMEKQRKLGEEEQAAVLLMALSCGGLFMLKEALTNIPSSC